MSGGILPLFTNVNTTPLWGAGGGGGGSNYPANATFSTITLADSADTAPNIIVPGQLTIVANDGIIFQSTASVTVPSIYFPGDGSAEFEDGTTVCCRIQPSNGYCSINPGSGSGIDIQVSTINGALPVVGQNVTLSNVNVSSIQGTPAILNATLVNPVLQSGGNIVISDPATSYTQDIVMTTNNMAITGTYLNGTIYHSPSGTANVTIASDDGGGGARNYIIANDATALYVVSKSGTIYTSTSISTADGSIQCGTLNAGASVNTASVVASGGVTIATKPVLAYNGPQATPYLTQSGYAQDFSAGSTILFAIPYSTDNVCVMLTPTNRNTVGGANPQCSLNNGYGNSGTGVSSIGFSVDCRNQGIGYNGSFFWQSMPLGS